MVNVNDCGCPCEDNGKKKQIEERALSSINKVYTTEGTTYYPDGTGMVTLPIPTTEQMQAIASVPDMASDIKQLKISDAEHTEQIATIDTNIDNHAREIASVKASISRIDTKDAEQDTELAGVSESLVSDITAQFNNDARKLTITLEREKAEPITAITTIPAGATGGGAYSAGDGIDISADNVITALVDGTTTKIINGKIASTASALKAGNGINIKDSVISQSQRLANSYSQKALTSDSGYTNLQFYENDGTGVGRLQTNFGENVRNTYIGVINDDTGSTHTLGIRCKPLIEGFAPSVDYTTASEDAIITKKVARNNFAPISISKELSTLKSSVENLQNATKVAVENFGITESADKVTITTTAIDGATSKSEDIPVVTDEKAGIVTPALKKKWDESSASAKYDYTNFEYFNNARYLTVAITKAKIGQLVTIHSIGKAKTSWSGFITGVVSSNTESNGGIRIISSLIQVNGEIQPICAFNYNQQPTATITDEGINASVLKGNSISGTTFSFDDSQGMGITYW